MGCRVAERGWRRVWGRWGRSRKEAGGGGGGDVVVEAAMRCDAMRREGRAGRAGQLQASRVVLVRW